VDSFGVEYIIALHVFDCSHVKRLSVSVEVLLNEEFVAFLFE
jgi:hypothetical protein